MHKKMNKNLDWVDINYKKPPLEEGVVSYSCDVLLTDGKYMWVGFIDFETEECLGGNPIKNIKPTHWMFLPKFP